MYNVDEGLKRIAKKMNCSEEFVKNLFSEMIETALKENNPLLTEWHDKIISEGKEPTTENYIQELAEVIKNVKNFK